MSKYRVKYNSTKTVPTMNVVTCRDLSKQIQSPNPNITIKRQAQSDVCHKLQKKIDERLTEAQDPQVESTRKKAAAEINVLCFSETQSFWNKKCVIEEVYY